MRVHRSVTGWIVLVSVALVAGCTSGGAAPATRSPATAGPRTAAPTVAAVHLYDPNANAGADIDAALAASKLDGRRVLIDFGADWCPDCHSLAAYMDGPAGRALIEPAFHVVRVDVGMFDHNLDIAQRYFRMEGIPTVVVLEASGGIVGVSTGAISLANARAMTEKQVLDELAAWVK
jgi:thiol:disulfide interchange protein